MHLDDFRTQLNYFSRTYGFVDRNSFLESLETGQSRPGMVFTFDDGFVDHYDQVLPVLKEMGLWGIFYIPTGVYGQERKLLDVHRTHLLLGTQPAQRLLGDLQERIRGDMLADAEIEAFRTRTYVHQHNDEATAAVKRILNYYLAPEHRRQILAELMESYFPEGEDDIARRFYMSPEQIGRLQEAGMIVGNHTVSHPVMSRLAVDEQAREIDEAFALLDRFTGGLNVRTFCYPYGGAHSFTAETVQLLLDRGCRFSFDFDPRDITGDDLRERKQALPRYDCNQFPYGQASQGTQRPTGKA
jgi:peptidoglycan/xylan/chitin deacetylase (PgdA/CDA1 family)